MIITYLISYFMAVGFKGLIGLDSLVGGEALLEMGVTDITVVIHVSFSTIYHCLVGLTFIF